MLNKNIAPPISMPGCIVLFGSGETSPSGRKVYERIFGRPSKPVRIDILETPAGFQPNSNLVAQKVGNFFKQHLQNHKPEINIIPARRRKAPFSTNDKENAASLPLADIIFIGPGSPTYAARHLRHSRIWNTILACHRQGATLVLASAAIIAAGVHVLPVYEIYKAGEDLHWCKGLDLFGPYGLSLALVSHWNNNEGGTELDTSHCFIGEARFNTLLKMLPTEVNIIGIDEHTALIIDIAEKKCHVMGKGKVTLIGQSEETIYTSGQDFHINELGPFRTIEPPTGIPQSIWKSVKKIKGVSNNTNFPQPPEKVISLVQARDEARLINDWSAADDLRRQIFDSGWLVEDTQNGNHLTSRNTRDA